MPKDEFHDRYDTANLLSASACPAFSSACASSGRRIALEPLAVLQSPASLAIGGQNLSPWSRCITSRIERLMRFEGEQSLPGGLLAPGDAGGLLPNPMSIAPELEAGFNEWYDKEHIPALATARSGCSSKGGRRWQRSI